MAAKTLKKRAGTQYGPEAIEKCLTLYLRFNGQQHERIEQEMRKAGYANWQRQYLYTRGHGQHEKIGWIEKYGWEKALELHLAQKPTAALNSAQQLVIETDTIRKMLYDRVRAQGAAFDKETLQFHRDYSRLAIEALTKIAEAKDTLGAWVNFWERLLGWMPDIDLPAAKLLVKHSAAIIEKAEEEFGETEDIAESLMNGDKNSAATGLSRTQA